MPEGLNNLASECHAISVAHGWWGDDAVTHPGTESFERNFPEVLMLIVTEVAEAMEEFRNGHEPAESYYRYSNWQQRLWGDVTFSGGKAYQIRVRRAEGLQSQFGEDTEEYRHELTHEDWVAMGATAKPEGVPSELADVIIRTLDTCAAYGIDIEKAIKEKMDFNRTRPYKHGGKRA